MRIEEADSLKLQYVSNLQTTTLHNNNVQDSDNEIAEKFSQTLYISEKDPILKDKPSFKKWCNYCRRYGQSIAGCRQKQHDNQNRPQKHREPNKSFYQYMKRDQNLSNKTFKATTAQENHFQIATIITVHDPPIELNFTEHNQREETHEILHKTNTADQIVRKISVELITQDQFQIEETTQTIIGAVLIQTL